MQDKIIDQIACPMCQSENRDTMEDNAIKYDGQINYFCVAGHGWLNSSSGKQGNQESVKKKNEVIYLNIKENKFRQGIYADIKSRNITKKTCEFYGYQVDPDTKDHIANYYNAAGNVIMQQIRTPDKQFPILGDKNANVSLYGSHLFTPTESCFITITEGQIDALSIAQSFNCKYPVVSLPNGCTAAKSVLLKNKKYLDGFKYVVLAFDNDEPGRKATEDCLRILEPGKVRIARWTGGKDANDLLQQNRERDIQSIIYTAVAYIPDPILTGDGLLDSLNHYQSKTMAWPFKNTKDIQPIRIPAVYTVAARSGVGKTEFVGEIIRSVIGNGGKIGVIALEQTMQQVLLKQTDALMGTKLAEIFDRELTTEEREYCRIAAENLVIYNHIQYGCDLLTIVDNIAYMVKTLDCQLIIFDNITYSLGGTKGDERRSIDIAMTKLKDSTIKYDYTIFNICHIKRENQFTILSDDEFPVSVDDIRGSQGIDMFSDYIIGLHRDKSNDNITLRNTLQACILKDRFTGGDVNKKFTMKFDKKTKRLS